MKFKKVIKEHYYGDKLSKVTKLNPIKEEYRKSINEDANSELYKMAMLAYKNNDMDFFYNLSDDELVTLWISCKITDGNPFGAAYDDEVYDAIHDRPNCDELFDRADTIVINKMPYDNLVNLYRNITGLDNEDEFTEEQLRKYVIDAVLENPPKNEDWSHFEFTSGSNPYIAKTKEDADRVKRSRGDSVRFVGNIDGIDYYKVDDSDEDMFSVDMDESKEPAQDKKPLNEGPGAGYTVKGVITNVNIHNVNECKFQRSDKYGNYYEVSLVASAMFEDVEAHSYYYGGKVGDMPIHISHCVICMDGEPTDEDIYDALSGAKIEAHIGGGWSHTTFDGKIDASVDKGEIDTYYDVLDSIIFDISEVSYVFEIDDLVTGAFENDEEDMDESLTESYTKVDIIECGEETYRVVGGGFNPTADALITVEDEHGERTRMHIGDVIEFYTWYDDKGNVIHEPEDMEESLHEDAQNLADKFADIFGVVTPEEEYGGFRINDTPICINTNARDENGESIEGFLFYTDGDYLIPAVQGGELDIQAPDFINVDGVQYGDMLQFRGNVEDEKLKSIFDELNSSMIPFDDIRA